MERIAVALVGNYTYINQILTTIKSVLFNNKAVDVYVLNPDIPQEVFVSINQRLSNSEYRLYNVKIDMGELTGIESTFKRIPKETYARFMAPDLVDAQKILYLDSDVIVNDDLRPLFEMMDVTDTVLAARERIGEGELPFNSGVMHY